MPTKVSGIPSTAPEAPREHRRAGRQPEPQCPRASSDGSSTTSAPATSAAGRCSIGLVVIVIFFSFKADNFLSPGNFSNIITQMAGVTLLAYGVVFVLLIGEIDLSISYVSGIAGVVVAQLTLPESGHQVPGLVAILARRRARARRSARSRARSSPSSACPAFVVTLAGYQIWQGVIQKSIEKEGVIVIQDETVNNTANYFFSNTAGLDHRRDRVRRVRRQRRWAA